jgi:RHS repeat-associated protein
VVDENRDYAQVLVEDDGAAQVSYTYGDDLISQERGGEAYYYHYDGLGSTRSLTDSQGDLANTYDYEAFGELLGQTGGVENGYLFAGEQFDPTLDQYYLRARYYDQSQGRFTQQDTWMGNDSDPITLHKYLYANVDPANNIDPTGNFSLGSLSAGQAVSAILTTASIGSTVVDTFDFLSGDGDVSAVDAGMMALASYGGFKLFKIIGKKFLKKFNCGRPGEHKICKIFKSDSQRIATIRSTLGISKKKNIAFADYITTDGVGTLVAASGEYTHPGTAGMPPLTRYITMPTGRNRRQTDSERKLYENLANIFNPSTKGLTRVVSELPICISCAGIGNQFRIDFPGIYLMTRGGVTAGRKK